MSILLLTLLAIAIVVTIAGLILSPRNRAPDQREVSYAERAVRRAPVSVDRQVRVRRSHMEVEPRAWTNMVASVNVGQIFGVRRANQPTPWLGLLLVLLAIFAFSFYTFNHFISNSTMIVGQTWPDVAASTPVAKAPAQASSSPVVFTNLVGASKSLVRLSQLDPAQYNSSQDYNSWAYSACSTASMTEVMNSYGHNYRIADVLKVEAGLGEITPDQGLLEDVGIDRTVARFGFKTVHIPNPTINTLIDITSHGRPVIVSFPPARWDGGHLLVVIGADKNYVYTADSSRLNMRVFTHDRFMKFWAGFAVVVFPNNQTA